MLNARHGLFGLLIAGGLASAGWYVLDGGRAHALAAPPAAPATPVNVTTVAQTTVPVELTGLGHVQAFNQVTVRPLVAGQITRIAYRQGALVKTGSLLVQIDPRPFQAKLDEDNANLQRDLAHLANARTDLGRLAPLSRQGYASAEQTATQQSLVAQEIASVAADKAVIAQDQLLLEYASVRSPITGIAGLRLVDVGNVVQPNDTQGMLTVTQIQPIALLFTLPQADLPDVQAEMNKGGPQLTVEAWAEDGSRKLATGRLTVINNSVDAANGTITLRAVFANRRKMLWPGEFAQARLVLRTVSNGLTVPAPAIQRGPSGSYVWVVTPDHIAKTQPVDVAQIVQGQALVTSGLQAGETVVTDGQYGLTQGSAVAIQSGDASTPLQNAQTDMLGIQP